MGKIIFKLTYIRKNGINDIQSAILNVFGSIPNKTFCRPNVIFDLAFKKLKCFSMNSKSDYNTTNKKKKKERKYNRTLIHILLLEKCVNKKK